MARPITSDSRPNVIVVIPCLNEEKTVGQVIGRVPRRIDGVGRIDVLVIDDGSTDRTAETARQAGAEVISHGINRGLGRTFREAVEIAVARGADIMVNIDGDGQFDAADIPLLLGPVAGRRADMATASRFLAKELVPEMPAIKKWGNRGVALVVALLTGKHYRDVSCGFRVFSRRALLRLNLFGGFTYTQEAFLDLTFKELEILEVPVSVRGTREHGTSRVAASLPRYAIRSLKIMLRAFVSYHPFKFFAAVAAIFMGIGLAFLLFLAMHYLRTGGFSPHIWAGFVGGSFGFLGVGTLVLGILGDMLVRIRMNQEHILVFLKSAPREGAHLTGGPREEADSRQRRPMKPADGA